MFKAEHLPKKSLILRTAVFAVGGVVAFLLHKMTPHLPKAVESIYSMGIYRALSPVLSRITGVFPFSLSEIIIPSAVIALVVLLLWGLVKSLRQKNPRPLLVNLCHMVCILMSFAMAFVFFWGLNYNRQSLYETMGLSAAATDKDRLMDMAEELISRANDLSLLVPRDADGVFTLDESAYRATRTAGAGYEELGEHFPLFAKTYAAPKCLLASELFTHLNITGIYLPFTFESNINTHVPALTLPSSAVHEMAHAYGIAAEEEANFVSFLACSLHHDVRYQYSGTVLALIHTMNALYDTDQTAWSVLRLTYSPDLHRDMLANNAFWDAYEGPAADIQEDVNDAYLKANHQTAGVKSYSHMVKLLSGWHEKYGTLDVKACLE